MPRAKKGGNANAQRAIGLRPPYRDLAVPLYEQVYTTLRDAIYRGALADGATMPSETELVRMMKVSRITVRRAIEELAARGLVVRAQGRGTRVRQNIGAEPIVANVEGLLENSLAMGFRTKVDVLEFDYIPASADVATGLDVPRGQEVQMNVRVRRLESQPFSHLTTFLPPEIGKRISRQDLGEQPILVLLETTGHSGYPRRSNDFGRSRPARCGRRAPSRGWRGAAQNRKACDRRLRPPGRIHTRTLPAGSLPLSHEAAARAKKQDASVADDRSAAEIAQSRKVAPKSRRQCHVCTAAESS